MANTELQTIASNVEIPQKTYDNMGNPVIVTPEGTSIPIYLSPFNGRIVQPGSIKNNKELQPHIRKFYIPDLEMSVDHLELVPILYKGIVRTLFPPYGANESTQEPICRSANGLTPDPRIETPMSMHCARITESGKVEALCEYAKWGDNKSPAQCQMSKLWIFYDINLNIPFYWQLKGTSLSAFNKAERAWKKQIDINRFKGINSANDILKVTFTDEGTYVKPEFTYINNPNVQNIAGVIAFYRNEFSNEDNYSSESESPAAIADQSDAIYEVSDNIVKDDTVIEASGTVTNTTKDDKKKTKDKEETVTLDSSFASDSGTPF